MDDAGIKMKAISGMDIVDALRKLGIQMNDTLKERIEYLGDSAVSKVEWELIPLGPLDTFRNGSCGARLEIKFQRVYKTIKN